MVNNSIKHRTELRRIQQKPINTVIVYTEQNKEKYNKDEHSDLARPIMKR